MAWNDENLTTSVTQETDAAIVSLGQRGFDYVEDTTARSANYAAIQILSPGTVTTFTTLTALNSTVGSLGTALVIPSGTIIYGPFTGFTLGASAKVIAYKAG